MLFQNEAQNQLCSLVIGALVSEYLEIVAN